MTSIICNKCFIEKETIEFYQRNKICKVCMCAHMNSEGYKKNKNEWRKRRRHELGISKRYREDICPASNPFYKSMEYKRLHRKKYKYGKKTAGNLSIKKIQRVYEDNIKKYGTLTCYLCEKPIKFGQDSLEHKIPLSRGGTNKYENLAIAHLSCNKKKHNKTENEYRLTINISGGK